MFVEIPKIQENIARIEPEKDYKTRIRNERKIVTKKDSESENDSGSSEDALEEEVIPLYKQKKEKARVRLGAQTVKAERNSHRSHSVLCQKKWNACIRVFSKRAHATHVFFKCMRAFQTRAYYLSIFLSCMSLINLKLFK